MIQLLKLLLKKKKWSIRMSVYEGRQGRPCANVSNLSGGLSCKLLPSLIAEQLSRFRIAGQDPEREALIFLSVRV